MIMGHNINKIWGDTTYDDVDKKEILEWFINRPYKYDTYQNENVPDFKHMYDLGLLKGHALHIVEYTDTCGKRQSELRGYIGISPLGKTWLDFNEL